LEIMTTRDYIRHALIDGSKTAIEVGEWCRSNGCAEIDNRLAGSLLEALKQGGEVLVSPEGKWFPSDDIREPRHAITRNGTKPAPVVSPVPDSELSDSELAPFNPPDHAPQKDWDEFVAVLAAIAPGELRDMELPIGITVIEIRRKLAKRSETKDSRWSVKAADPGRFTIKRFSEAETKEVARQQDAVTAVRKRALGGSVEHPAVLVPSEALEGQETPPTCEETAAPRALPPVEPCHCGYPDFWQGATHCKNCGGSADGVPISSPLASSHIPTAKPGEDAPEAEAFMEASLRFWQAEGETDEAMQELTEVTLPDLSAKIIAWREAWPLARKLALAWWDGSSMGEDFGGEDDPVGRELICTFQSVIRDKIMLRNELRWCLANADRVADRKEAIERLIAEMEAKT
jgi:hypothetical protein